MRARVNGTVQVGREPKARNGCNTVHAAATLAVLVQAPSGYKCYTLDTQFCESALSVIRL
jgi:hypothetical protein